MNQNPFSNSENVAADQPSAPKTLSDEEIRHGLQDGSLAEWGIEHLELINRNRAAEAAEKKYTIGAPGISNENVAADQPSAPKTLSDEEIRVGLQDGSLAEWGVEHLDLINRNREADAQAKNHNIETSSIN